MLLMLPFMVTGQTSIVEMLSKFSSSRQADFIKKNHTELSYMRHYDDEVPADTVIVVNEEEIKFKLSSSKKYIWKNNILTIEETYTDGNTSIQTFEFDAKGNIVMNDSNYGSGDMGLLNEKKIFVYDENNRLITLRLLKENMAADNVIYEASFEDNSSMLPTSAKLNVIMEFDINREPINNGFKYNFIGKIPQDLIDMVKESLGGNPSQEEIMKELGPFGKIEKKYSIVEFQNNDILKEDVYDEDKKVADKMNLTSTLIFDKNFNLLSKKVFSAGETVENTVWEYNNQNKVISIQKSDEEKKINEFDNSGNYLKEYSDYGYLDKSYTSGQLTLSKEYNFDSLTSFTVYKY